MIEYFNLQLLRAYAISHLGNHIYPLFCIHTEHHVIAVQVSLPTYYRMARTHLIFMGLASMLMTHYHILLHYKLD